MFQATAELLEAAPMPKFIVLSSAAGNIACQENLPLASTAYGSSKAAANFATRKIHFEHPKIVTIPIHRGWLRTDVSFQVIECGDDTDMYRWETQQLLALTWRRHLHLWKRALMVSSNSLIRLRDRRARESSWLPMEISFRGSQLGWSSE